MPILTTIIGVDYATDPKQVGLALGTVESGMVVVRSVRCGRRSGEPSEVVAEWLSSGEDALVAIDAPLGWPAALGPNLLRHHAGHPLPTPADALFHRATDSDIERRLGKRPLEVGANLIARTAHSALAFLDEVRRLTGMPIPLAWAPGSCDGTSAIEVYPAATLCAYKIDATRYKKTADTEGRCRLVERLRARADLSGQHELLERSADALDAVICLIAGADFLGDRVVPPTDPALARKEGWIWAPMQASR